MMKQVLLLSALMLMVALCLSGFGQGPEGGQHQPSRDPQVGQAFQVPYRLTETNHFLVRVRINGKGPFHFLVDSGAPALYIATESAAKINLKPAKGEFWTPVDRLELEGGVELRSLKARVEDPFQLVGMNALGLPGVPIDGILGFTILARFRLEIDPTRDRMTWTRLAFAPPDPPIPHGDGHGAAPAELQAMNALGPIAKGLAFLMGKQPEEQREPRGFLGLEWVESTDPQSGQRIVQIRQVLAGSPAAKAHLQAGDTLVRIGQRPVTNIRAARTALASVKAGDPVELTIHRVNREQTAGRKREQELNIITGEGL
jgi:hypothetical protein